MASRRESRANSTSLNTLQEFENLRKTFKASNDRLAKKNNELLAQISQLTKQLQESAAENFQLRGTLSALQRKQLVDNSRSLAYQRERQAMLDLVDETTRAADWAKKNLASLRRSFDAIDSAEPPATSPPAFVPKPRSSTSNALKVSAAPDMELIHEDSKEDMHSSPRVSRRVVAQPGPSRLSSHIIGTLQLTEAAVSTLNAESSMSSPAASGNVAKRKTLRRQSGLLGPIELNTQSSSPSTPSQAGLTESPNFLSPPLDHETSSPSPQAHLTPRRAGRGKRKLSVDEMGRDDLPEYSAAISGLHDVTNSPPPRLAEGKPKKSTSLKNNGAQEDFDYALTPPLSRVERRSRKLAPRNTDHDEEGKPIRPTSPHNDTLEPASLGAQRSASPTPRSRSPIPQPVFGAALIGSQHVETSRERRVRKSVNYAEPKLNTKMRKPDGFEASFKNRPSTTVSAAKWQMPSSSTPPANDPTRAPAKRRETNVPSASPRPPSPVTDEEPIRPLNGTREREKPRSRRRLSQPSEDQDDEADEEQDRKIPMWKAYPRTPSTTVPSSPHDAAAIVNSNVRGLAGMALPDADEQPTTKRRRRATSYAGLELSDEDEDDDEYREDGEDDFVLPRSVSRRRKSNTAGFWSDSRTLVGSLKDKDRKL
ncbi:uncharacterized protein EI90DRAFT_3155582 [Cantharellus anzutake]|uniref:uncharacterized protein n=1 Tax=Cantharellus anzutake TaxID=1750568 RepID=UPI001908212F|nr:uncharacterized protein EI90DRAFT_3155582 [Cantharellus anzutake]KAF8328851.1 hypothetical protein EI90DRAFT_3155582 [Cantharellus anzutake]